LFQNLRSLGFISESNSNRADIDIDVNRLNGFFISKSSRTEEIDFDIPQTENVPEFSFSTVTETDVKEAILWRKLKRKKKHQKPRKLEKWTNWVKVDFGIWTAPHQDSPTAVQI
jgi:hypothetical protein